MNHCRHEFLNGVFGGDFPPSLQLPARIMKYFYYIKREEVWGGPDPVLIYQK